MAGAEMEPNDVTRTVPMWMVDLRAEMRELQTELRALVAQIPAITQKLESMVPMHEHLKLMADVEELKKRDVGERKDWEEIKTRVPVMWDERSQVRGAIRFWKATGVVLGGALALLTILTLVHNAEVSISYKP